MYQGIIKWRDTFEGETSDNNYATLNPNPRALLNSLLEHLMPNDELILLVIRPEDD